MIYIKCNTEILNKLYILKIIISEDIEIILINPYIILNLTKLLYIK